MGAEILCMALFLVSCQHFKQFVISYVVSISSGCPGLKIWTLKSSEPLKGMASWNNLAKIPMFCLCTPEPEK